jgi:osmoprotectant transport system permease protein
VRRYLKEADGITLVCPLGFENAYALAMREADAARLGIRRIGDLEPLAPRMSIGGDYEFFSRPEWKALQQVYGLHFASERSMDSSLMYQAVAQGNVDVLSAFSTDGRIAAFGLRVLDDDRGAIPPYDAVILASGRLAARHPDVVAALATLGGTIDAARMRRMNFAVDEQGESPAAVARQALEELR